MGMAKYFEDNMEIIEERRDNYNSSCYEHCYNYGNSSPYARKSESTVKTIRTSYYITIGGKRIAV